MIDIEMKRMHVQMKKNIRSQEQLHQLMMFLYTDGESYYIPRQSRGMEGKQLLKKHYCRIMRRSLIYISQNFREKK